MTENINKEIKKIEEENYYYEKEMNEILKSKEEYYEETRYYSSQLLQLSEEICYKCNGNVNQHYKLEEEIKIYRNKLESDYEFFNVAFKSEIKNNRDLMTYLEESK